MATEVLLYLVIVLLIMQVVFIGIVINLQKMVNLWKKDFWSSLKQ